MDRNTLLRCNNLRFRDRKRNLIGSISVNDRGSLQLTQKIHPVGMEHVVEFDISTEEGLSAFNKAYPKFEIVPRCPKYYFEFKEGDIIASMDNPEEKYRIIFRSGDFVAYKAFRTVEGKVSTVSSLRKGGYRLVLTSIENEVIAAKASEFHEGEMVIVQETDLKPWTTGVFSEYNKISSQPYMVKVEGEDAPKKHLYCLPFNDENIKLLGTTLCYWKMGGSL